MKTWHFGIDNDKLVNLVLEGKKTATTSLYDIDDIPVISEESILLFDNDKEACITKIIDYKIMKFKDMTEDLSKLEGEGDLSLGYWKKEHIKLFKSIDPTFNEDRKVIFEIFKVTKNLVNERLKLGKTIADLNLDIFKKSGKYR